MKFFLNPDKDAGSVPPFLDRKLILEMSQWHFASQEEQSSRYRSLLAHVKRACSRANTAESLHTGADIHNSSAFSSGSLPHSAESRPANQSTPEAIPSILHHRNRLDHAESSSLPCLSDHLASDQPLSSSFPETSSINHEFDFWDKRIAAHQPHMLKASPDQMREAISSHYRWNFEQTFTDGTEKSKVLQLMLDQLFGGKTELSREECLEFMDTNSKGIPPVDTNDLWWTALMRAVALQICMKYL